MRNLHHSLRPQTKLTRELLQEFRKLDITLQKGKPEPNVKYCARAVNVLHSFTGYITYISLRFKTESAQGILHLPAPYRS